MSCEYFVRFTQRRFIYIICHILVASNLQKLCPNMRITYVINVLNKYIYIYVVRKKPMTLYVTSINHRSFLKYYSIYNLIKFVCDTKYITVLYITILCGKLYPKKKRCLYIKYMKRYVFYYIIQYMYMANVNIICYLQNKHKYIFVDFINKA